LTGGERERADGGNRKALSTGCDVSLADRLVVAGKPLLAGVAVERRGRLTRNVDSFNRSREALGGSE
jgi:hypothetical protein